MDRIFAGCPLSRIVKSRGCTPDTGLPDLSMTTASSTSCPGAEAGLAGGEAFTWTVDAAAESWLCCDWVTVNENEEIRTNRISGRLRLAMLTTLFPTSQRSTT